MLYIVVIRSPLFAKQEIFFFFCNKFILSVIMRLQWRMNLAKLRKVEAARIVLICSYNKFSPEHTSSYFKFTLKSCVFLLCVAKQRAEFQVVGLLLVLLMVSIDTLSDSIFCSLSLSSSFSFHHKMYRIQGGGST